jgi:hypothetical protein
MGDHKRDQILFVPRDTIAAAAAAAVAVAAFATGATAAGSTLICTTPALQQAATFS